MFSSSMVWTLVARSVGLTAGIGLALLAAAAGLAAVDFGAVVEGAVCARSTGTIGVNSTLAAVTSATTVWNQRR